jgi:hypothetical protein
MKAKATPQEPSELWDVGSWQEAPSQHREARKPGTQARGHRFHLRPQLVGTILITIVALSAGLAIGPYVTPPPVVTTTVTSVVHDTITVTITTISSSGPTTTSASPACPNGHPKWLANANVIPYQQAASHVGQSITVEGTIVYTNVSGGTTFLDFHYPYQGYFYAVVFSSDRGNFAFAPESFYRNKEVRITGAIQPYKGSPEIIVHSPSQIEVACMGFNYP